MYAFRSDDDPPVAVRRVLTVHDILDWATTMATTAPETIAAAGQLGLNLVADQADELFWLIEAIYGAPEFEIPDHEPVIRPDRDLPAELVDAQVRREFLNLARDLNELADLASATPTPEG
jgi:hypothetical protein